eukprot:g29898.t1
MMILHISSFRTDALRRFTDWIDEWGGWWLYRWGDAAIRAVQVWLMLEARECYEFSDLAYAHQHFCRCAREIDAPCTFLGRGAKIFRWSCEKKPEARSAAEKLDFEDKAILEGLVAVEKAHQEDVVLYHAVPFSIYMLSWIWNGVLDVNAPYPIGKMPLSIRVFDGSKQFPSFSAPDPAVCPPPTGFAEVAEVDHPEVFVGRIVGSSSRKVQYSLNSSSGCFPLVYLGKVKQAKYVDSLMEEQLVEHGVINASDFQQYCEAWILTVPGLPGCLPVARKGPVRKHRPGSVWLFGLQVSWEKLGVWKDEHNTPDHIAGVRERLLSVNLNIFGSESWAESSWEIFRKGVSLHHSGLGGAVPFMDDILSALQVDEEVTSLEHPNELEVNDPWMPAEKCHKTIVGTSDNKKCGTDIMMQLIFPRDLAEQLVYISGAGGIPRDEFSKFLPAYDELKNTAAGDGHQGRILLKGDVFCRGLRSFAAFWRSDRQVSD